MKKLLVILSAICIGMFAVGCAPQQVSSQTQANEEKQEAPEASDSETIRAYLTNPAVMDQFVNSTTLKDASTILLNCLQTGDVDSAMQASQAIAQAENDFLKVECPPACRELHDLMKDYYAQYSTYASNVVSATDKMSQGNYDATTELDNATNAMNEMTRLMKEITAEYQNLTEKTK